ncbi:MAG TPA: hypothetical protein DEP82_05095 [Arthrobacter bacterium]|nr:hypothetical protein [Arthrobacter sp.]HAP88519.1 hypothetical protein [Arthrobacter sp.]HCB57312.1 hypothetical protein [Arthrobacter sp.]HCC40641.1 hypothetical protein [Arthrobacter sp.]
MPPHLWGASPLFRKRYSPRPREPQRLSRMFRGAHSSLAGFMTEHAHSMLVADPTDQNLASALPIGKRLKSAPNVRVGETNPVTWATIAADGRCRIYVFAD